MIEISVVVTNPSGLHARPASIFVKAAAKFRGTTVKVVKDGREADSKSIISLLSLGIRQGATILIRAGGPQEQEAVQELAGLITSGLGEISPCSTGGRCSRGSTRRRRRVSPSSTTGWPSLTFTGF